MRARTLQVRRAAPSAAHLRVLVLAVALSGTVFGQQLSHSLAGEGRDGRPSIRAAQASPDTIRLLAAMVQFQPDTDIRTTGPGQFDLTTPADSIIDPPPRNRRYFEDHLLFLSNYFRTVSRGRLVIEPTVIDSVVTLPTVMATYSPARNASNEPVARLARDTWRAVDSLRLVQDFSRYTCFTVFHAGVGRDIDLIGAIGYDPAPLDIPSLYLSLTALREFYGPTFAGFPVQGGAFAITNSLILPETESRLLPTISGDLLLELGINGLLCASFGSHLGLPDLFDTKTGRSGIGRFGLMDGQAIFSFAGVFPPEPSAWEKATLGWVTPVTVRPGTAALTMPAVGLTTPDAGLRDSGDVIFRIPISATEYYLVENRNRDPRRNGQSITSTFNGVTRQQQFARDTVGFNSLDVSSLAGVVTAVEDFDWSLPGGVDNEGTFYDGGILIWHIDESVIEAGLPTNTVNANPDRRGVDLEEADGSQDIGQSYEAFTPGSGSEEGTALDFWFVGNASPVNKNSFSPTTFPDTRSSGGAQTQITVKDFSARGPAMTATVVLGDQRITPLADFPRTVGEALSSPALNAADLSEQDARMLVLTAGGSAPQATVFAWSADSGRTTRGFRTSGAIALLQEAGQGFGSLAAIQDLNGDGAAELVLPVKPAATAGQGGSGPSEVRAYTMQDADGDSLADRLFSTVVSGDIVSHPTFGDSVVAVPTVGKVYFLTLDGVLLDSVHVQASGTDSRVWVSRLSGGNEFAVVTSTGAVRITSRSARGGVTAPDRTIELGRTAVGPAVASWFAGGGNAAPGIAIASADGLVYLFSSDLVAFPNFPVDLGDSILQPCVPADVDGDGARDIVAFTRTRVVALGTTGAMLTSFPITVPLSGPITSAPVIGDVDGDGFFEIIGATKEGVVFGYTRAGTMAAGFPLQAGRGDLHSLALVRAGGTGLEARVTLAVAASGDASLSAWSIGIGSATPPQRPGDWLQYQYDAHLSGNDPVVLNHTPLSSQFFPEERAYNWPNPVYDGKTYFRYYVGETSTVTIRVFDFAGDQVAELQGPGIAGFDNEVAWDVKDIQSGVYFARIEASGGGKSGTAVVKVAIVK